MYWYAAIILGYEEPVYYGPFSLEGNICSFDAETISMFEQNYTDNYTWIGAVDWFGELDRPIWPVYEQPAPLAVCE